MSKKVIKYFVSLFLLLAVAFIAIKVKGKQQQISQTSEPVSISETIVHDENTDTAIQLEIQEDEKPESIVQAVIETVQDEDVQETLETVQIEEKRIDEEGSYTDKEGVALYIHTYGKLPQNYIDKKTAESLGWKSGESVSSVAPGKSIGGDRFGNYEQLLPKKKGRVYYECDIDAYGKKSRGAKRIVFSNDGLIYYTNDHYESFELLYGEE